MNLTAQELTNFLEYYNQLSRELQRAVSMLMHNMEWDKLPHFTSEPVDYKSAFDELKAKLRYGFISKYLFSVYQYFILAYLFLLFQM